MVKLYLALRDLTPRIEMDETLRGARYSFSIVLSAI